MKLGLSALLKIGANTITNVKDLSLNIEKAEADGTTRASGGWRAIKGTLKSATLEFGMNVDETDTHGYAALRTAFLGNTEVASVSIEDGSGYGLAGTFEVTGFNYEQNLEDIQTVSVTMKPVGALTNVTPGS